MDIVKHNREFWNIESREGGQWSVPVSSEQVANARQGQWEIILTPRKPVPKDWFGSLQNKKVLGLASGGGQQMPILAAAGAVITSFDNSDEQLAKDLQVAQKEGLAVTTIQGDMADLSPFKDCQFDLIFHPASNLFVADINKVWNECFRVLKPGGRLLSGFMNPSFFMFDQNKAEVTGKLEVEFTLPYSSMDSGNQDVSDAIVFSHTLETQIGGQINAGFTINGFYEDKWTDEDTLLNKYMATSMATLAVKPT